eukprot:GHVO01034183.1.p1 GENE.GHVO01034183.1~~GHVO01034183.1.p1  ORF type:complete len:113 (-),score=18.12 GHVO01034183.1:442-780(-)
MKICREMVEAMGGQGSDGYIKFLSLCGTAYRLIRSLAPTIVRLVEMMEYAGLKDLKPAVYSEGVIPRLIERFHLGLDDARAEQALLDVIETSVRALFPLVFDKFHEWVLYWK